MHETVENRVGERRVADDVMPLVDGKLAGHDRRAHAVAVLEDLEQVVAVLGAERSQRPIVHHQDLGLGERLEDAGKVLDDDSLPNGRVEAVREGLKALDEERQSGDRLATATREVLGRLAAADLPLPVLARALDEIRMSQSCGPGGRRRAARTAAAGGRAPLDRAGK